MTEDTQRQLPGSPDSLEVQIAQILCCGVRCNASGAVGDRCCKDLPVHMSRAKAIAALSTSSVSPEDGWKTMESAPKDGEVLLRVKMRAGIPGGYLVGHYMAGGHCIEGHPPIDAGWYFWNGCMFDKASEPTHWRPLPASSDKPEPKG